MRLAHSSHGARVQRRTYILRVGLGGGRAAPLVEEGHKVRDGGMQEHVHQLRLEKGAEFGGRLRVLKGAEHARLGLVEVEALFFLDARRESKDVSIPA